MKISWILIQKVIDLLCTFQGHLPSFSTLDETATTNTGWVSAFRKFGVASWFSPFWGFFKKQFIKNMWKKILPLVSVHGGSPPFPDFNGFLHPSLVSVLLRAYDLCPIPSNDVVLLHNMVCDRGFMDWWQRLLSTGSCDHRFAHLIHFSFVFIKTGTKFAARFTNVFKITIHTRKAIQSICGVVVISLVFWMDQKATKSSMRFTSRCHVVRFHHSADLFCDSINVRKNCHTSTFDCVIFLFCDFLWCFLLHLIFNFFKSPLWIPTCFQCFPDLLFFFSLFFHPPLSRCYSFYQTMSWWHPIFGAKGGVIHSSSTGQYA